MVNFNQKEIMEENFGYTKQKKRGVVTYVLIPIITSIVCFAAGYLLSITMTKSRVEKAAIRSVMNQFTPSGFKYSTIFSLIQNNYVEEIAIDSIAESMIPDLLHRLDPHSSYIPAKDVQISTANLEGKFDGVGIVFNMVTDTIVVQSVVPGGPSSKVGIISGDRIMTIDKKLVAGQKIPSDSILRKLRGIGGTKVELGIAREDIDSIMNITVTRGKVVLNSVDAAFMITPTTGYVKLLRFARTTHKEIMDALDKLYDSGMEHLVLDLTDNRGGYLDQAIAIANEFIAVNRNIVTTKQRGEVIQATNADGRGKYIGKDVIVLMNENSASSSEIVAGALQDNDIGTIVGRRSFGKGLVQQQVPLSDGSILNLTIANYHTPTGRSIQRPYKGMIDEYDQDFVNRITGGELTNRDSVRIDTTLKYITPMGKVVYGGGGIMPDVFVPIDTAKYTLTERKLLISLVMIRYTNRFIDQNRKELLKVENQSDLDKFFDIYGEKMYAGYIEYVNSQGAEISKKDASESRSTVMNVLKAYVGQFTKEGDNALYRYLQAEDDILQEALKIVKEREN